MIQFLLTVLMLVALVYFIKKQYNATMVLFIISLIALAGVTIATQTPLGTSGSAALDVFEMVTSTAGKSLSGTLLTIASVLGYVTYMNKIEASQLFATIIAKPLTKLKKPYLMAALVVCLGWVLKLVIPSGLSMLSLMIGILYPVLLAVGATRATCAAAFMCATFVLWGPSESGVSVCTGLVEGATVAEFFTKYEVPLVLINMAVMLIVFPLTQKMFDKKENAQGANADEIKTEAKEFNIPKFYATFPLLPLLFVIVFSPLVVKTIKIQVPTACFISLLIVTILRMIAEHKDLKQIVNDTQVYYDGMGSFIGRIGFIIVAGTLFSTAITQVGGIKWVLNLASSAGISPFITCLITGILAFVVVALSGSINANISLFAGIFNEIALNAGLNPLPLLNAFLLMGAPGCAFVPFSGVTHLVAGTCDVDMMTMFKREAIPAAAVLLSTIIFTFVLY